MSCVPKHNICRKRGDTKAMTFRLLVDGAPHDISGDTILLTVNTEEDPADTSSQLFQLTATFPNGGTDGLFSFAPAADQPEDPGEYFFDFQWDDGTILTILEGKYSVDQDITKT